MGERRKISLTWLNSREKPVAGESKGGFPAGAPSPSKSLILRLRASALIFNPPGLGSALASPAGASCSLDSEATRAGAAAAAAEAALEALGSSLLSSVFLPSSLFLRRHCSVLMILSPFPSELRSSGSNRSSLASPSCLQAVKNRLRFSRIWNGLTSSPIFGNLPSLSFEGSIFLTNCNRILPFLRAARRSGSSRSHSRYPTILQNFPQKKNFLVNHGRITAAS